MASTPIKPTSNGLSIDYCDDEHHLDHPLRIGDIGHLDDISNGQRLVRLFGNRFRYDITRKGWRFYDGKRWKMDDAHAIEDAAKQTARSLYADASVSEDDAAKRLAKFAEASARRSSIDAMVKMARSEPGIAIRAEDLDADPWLFNVANGTIDLRTGKIHDHNPDDLISMLAPVAYRPDADAPLFRKFLNRTFDGSERLIGFHQRWLGYCLTGGTTERAMLIQHGGGANGKSVLEGITCEAMGDYAASTPAGTLMASQRDDSRSPRNDLAALRGVRLVCAAETGEGHRLDEPVVKRITGGDAITSRFLNCEFFTYVPAFKVMLTTNHRPEVRGTDEAIWDRILLLPFGVRIPESERDPDLRLKLRRELPGILAWAVRGCIEWQRDRLNAPDEVRAAVGAYRAEQDHLGEFISEACVLADGMSVGATPLFDAYATWCKGAGVEPMTQTAFGKRLTDRGIPSERCKATSRKIRRGIGVRNGGMSQ